MLLSLELRAKWLRAVDNGAHVPPEMRLITLPLRGLEGSVDVNGILWAVGGAKEQESMTSEPRELQIGADEFSDADFFSALLRGRAAGWLEVD